MSGKSESTRQDISSIVEKGLCTGCTLCAAFCPQKAIYLALSTDGFIQPSIDNRCTHCGLCLEICPGDGTELSLISERQMDAERHDLLVGRYHNIYLGCAVERSIAIQGSSGGIATALSLFSLDSHQVNGVVCTAMKNVNPATSEIRVCDSRADILNSIGSKYCPVHLGENLCGLLGKSPRRGLKAIFVGLPCQIESIRKAERALPGLAKSIPLKIGLYCGNLPSALATRYILKTNRITDEDVSSISYRDSHWPGSMIIRLKNGSRVTLPFLQYWNTGFGQFFARIRCLVCADHTSELADLSLADPWVRLGRKPAEKKGQTVVISRTSAGEEYLRQASQAGYIHLEECSLDEVIQQGTVFKKRNMRSLPARLLLFPSRTPSRYEYPLPMDAASLWWIFCSRIGGFLAGNESLWPLLRLFSSSLFRGSVKSRKTEVNASIDA